MNCINRIIHLVGEGRCVPVTQLNTAVAQAA